MSNFYEELKASEEKQNADLLRYEEVCHKYVLALRQALQKILDWPPEKINLVAPEASKGPYIRRSKWAYLDRDGYHFSLKISAPADWSTTFDWSLRALPEHALKLIVSATDPMKSYVVKAPDPDILPEHMSEVGAYVRSKLREIVRDRTLADLVDNTPPHP